MNTAKIIYTFIFSYFLADKFPASYSERNNLKGINKNEYKNHRELELTANPSKYLFSINDTEANILNYGSYEPHDNALTHPVRKKSRRTKRRLSLHPKKYQSERRKSLSPYTPGFESSTLRLNNSLESNKSYPLHTSFVNPIFNLNIPPNQVCFQNKISVDYEVNEYNSTITSIELLELKKIYIVFCIGKNNKSFFSLYKQYEPNSKEFPMLYSGEAKRRPKNFDEQDLVECSDFKVKNKRDFEFIDLNFTATNNWISELDLQYTMIPIKLTTWAIDFDKLRTSGTTYKPIDVLIEGKIKFCLELLFVSDTTGKIVSGHKGSNNTNRAIGSSSQGSNNIFRYMVDGFNFWFRLFSY